MKDKKFLVILGVVVVVCIVLGITLGKVLSGSDDSDSKGKVKTQIKLDNNKKVNVVKNEASLIKYEKYDNGLVSFNIPKGWKVTVAPYDYIHYSFKVTNPNDANYSFFFCMKLEGFNPSEEAKNWQKKYYPNELFAKLPAINPHTTEAFYKIWNETADYVNDVEIKSAYLPKMNDFTVIEKLGTNEIGGDILRATYTTSDNKKVQGLFTASVKKAGTTYVKVNPYDFYSTKQIDIFPLLVYNIMYMTAPEEEFNDWQAILDNCLATIEFSKEFVNGFNKEESQILTTIQANQKIYDSISDMIMDSWEKRNNSYDIISQKQSDATLGYERVYDTETGEIYKAYNGFTDDYSGNRYQSITDDMYTKATSGYIEKVR